MPAGRLGTPDFPPKEVLESKEFTQKHLVWDFARVAERYGLPDFSTISDSYVTWGYQLGERRSVWFDFVGGVVCRVRSQ
jgi:hypothetical protein